MNARLAIDCNPGRDCGARCCSPVPLTAERAAAIRAALGEEWSSLFVETPSGILTRSRIIDQPDASIEVRRCALYDPLNGNCKAYDLRPPICVEYRCYGKPK